TIVSTCLPTITSDLHADQVDYTWVAVAYQLAQTACQPLYGKVSDMVGRKKLLYFSVGLFAVGSLLCGFAQTISWLISARVVAGVGAGGIVSSVWVITSAIVEVESRAKWSQALSITWASSAIAGPLLGGGFSDSSVFMNIPICAVSWVIFFFSLRGVDLPSSSDTTIQTLLRKFDFVGLFLFMGGSCTLMTGLALAEIDGWKSPSTLVPVILGVVLFMVAYIHELRTERECIFPRAFFKNMILVLYSLVFIVAISFLHQVVFNTGTYYLSLYFQAATGASALLAGIKLLPYSLGSSLASIPSSMFVHGVQKKTGDTMGQNIIISCGLGLTTLGFGLIILLDQYSSIVCQVVFQLIAGIGIGFLFHCPHEVLTAAVGDKNLASVTSAFFLVRFTGASVGLSIAGAIYSGSVAGKLPDEYNGSHASIDYSLLHSLQPLSVRNEIVDLIARSIRNIWIFCTPAIGVAFLVSLS
ncbi:amino acid permease ScVBA-like protein, partial [Fistulina hepatica ATCC 64428]